MIREEAANIIKECKEKGFKHTFYTLNDYHTALDMAIKALEQEPFMNKPCAAHQICHEDKVKVLDKIKGYVDHIRNTGMGKKKSLEFIEKFIEGLKAESEDAK